MWVVLYFTLADLSMQKNKKAQAVVWSVGEEGKVGHM